MALSEGNEWWIILLFLFIMGNGWNGNGGVMDQYVLNSDFATLQRQLDSSTDRLAQQGNQISNGLCDGFYAMNTTLLNGFSGVNSAITQTQINEMQNANAVQSQIANTNYNMCSNTRDIVDNQNANTRAILDALNGQALAAKDAKIAEQTQQINALQLAASQQAQNNYVVSQLAPKLPIASYNVPNPYSGCGCNCY